MYLNHCQFVGNLVKDPEMKITPNNKSVTKFTLAVQRDSKDEDAKVDYIPFVAWNKTAETINEFAKKGRSLLVFGRLEIDKKGEGADSKYYPTIVVSSFKFNDSKKKAEE